MFQRTIAILIVLHCDLANAQWSSFKPVTIDQIPEDQRDISDQTVLKGRVVPKEIRVDWYGFTLKDNTNVIEDRFQYPVADPTLAPGDEIVRIHVTDVTDAESVHAALRVSSDKNPLSVSVKRLIDGETKTVKVALYRANSIILKQIVDSAVTIHPPRLIYRGTGNWGEARIGEMRVVAMSDEGVPIFRGALTPYGIDSEFPAENLVLRGWNLDNLSAGDVKAIPPRDPGHLIPADASTLTLMSGSSGMPKKRKEFGVGFLTPGAKPVVRRSSKKPAADYHIIGIGENEILKVDGKDLEVHVLINME